MRVQSSGCLALVVLLSLIWGILGLPKTALAKVFLYAITLDGELLKYDPDADQIVQRTPVGQRYINQRSPDNSLRVVRVLDVARGRIITFANEVAGVVFLNIKTAAATEIVLGPPDSVVDLRQLVYPRKASRFHVHWVRQASPTAPREVLLTSLDLGGRILETVPSVLGEFSSPWYHPDGKSFYIFSAPRIFKLIDGDTLTVQATYDLNALAQPGKIGPGIADVRDGRVLLTQGAGTRRDLLDPKTVLTVDLTFAPQSASPRIDTGIGVTKALLAPGARTIVLQEALTPTGTTGAGRLHFYDVTTGSKLGTVSFRSDRGAILLGFHPDGRRLFIQAYNRDTTTGQAQKHLVIVDVVTRTVVRDRTFDEIGFAVDFVDE